MWMIFLENYKYPCNIHEYSAIQKFKEFVEAKKSKNFFKAIFKGRKQKQSWSNEKHEKVSISSDFSLMRVGFISGKIYMHSSYNLRICEMG
jgi:hypothetical protein